ncbi:dTMP kinase [Coralliovum pocilloporae]|uniref:dTMP kinase n=1 Tax=Coralliovum pocilloporae TaxID=3066369 RepID=UPI0033075A32
MTAKAGAGLTQAAQPSTRSSRRIARGQFITFEGGEGVGKSTQIQLLADRLQKAGITVVQTREPGGSPAAEVVREVLLSGAAQQFGEDTEAILFAAARADHVSTRIKPALNVGYWVLCDRFIDSTRAYQGGDTKRKALLDTLERTAIDGLKPNLTFILDLDPKTGLSRAAKRADLDRFEQDDLAAHEERRRVFLAIARREKRRCVVIDADQEINKIADDIWQVVKDRFKLEEGTSDG